MPKTSSGSITKISLSLGSGSDPKDDSKSSHEGESVGNYDEDFQENEEHGKVRLLQKTGDYYYQDYNYRMPTQSDFERKQVHDVQLFGKIKKIVPGSDYDVVKEIEPYREASILISGFGMRNVESFQRLIQMSHDERKKWELRKLWREKQAQEALAKEQERREKADAEASARTDITSISSSTRSRASSSDFVSQTETSSKTSEGSGQKKELDYLLGLRTEVEEQGAEELEAQERQLEDEFKYSTSKSIREAQKYLRVHRIFECFQFIIAQLLGANAKNPIEFILNLLNRCLLYRSGLGDPPLLYEKKHIGQLFILMDRFQTGFIDFEQYKMAMKTLGVCSYNEDPDVNDDDLISKETFIEEAYEAELAIFSEFIKRRPDKDKKKENTPSSFESVSVDSLNPPLFIPSDLYKFRKTPPDSGRDYADG